MVAPQQPPIISKVIPNDWPPLNSVLCWLPPSLGDVPDASGASAGDFLDYQGNWSAAGGGGGTKTVATVASVGAGVSVHALGVSVSTTPTANYVDLYISGVYQSKTSYTVSGSNLTLASGTFPTGALVETVTTT